MSNPHRLQRRLRGVIVGYIVMVWSSYWLLVVDRRVLVNGILLDCLSRVSRIFLGHPVQLARCWSVVAVSTEAQRFISEGRYSIPVNDADVDGRRG